MRNFITKIIENTRSIVKTRFCPEPGGQLHIGHIKNFIINYKVSKIYKGKINIRMDDSNPIKSKELYKREIYYEILKLGFKKKIKLSYSSDYFNRIYLIIKAFIKRNMFYIDNSITKGKNKKIRFNKRTIYKHREIREKLYLVKKMKKGIFKTGEFVVRANIINYKGVIDPIMARIIKVANRYIYPTYDLCNSISDRIEKITFSICTNEFINNKAIYNWLINRYNKIFKKKLISKQIEFSKIEIEGEVLGKRNIKKLINKGIIKNWKDPRLYTVKGLVNRGFSNKSIKEIALKTGYTKTNCITKKSFIKRILLKNLTKEVKRKTAVIIKPVKIIIINTKNNNEFFIEGRNNIRCLYSFFLKKRPYTVFFIKKKVKCYIYIYINVRIKKEHDNCISKGNVKNAVIYIYKGNRIKKIRCILQYCKVLELERSKIKLQRLGYFNIYKKKELIICKEIILFNSIL
ncbi:glutamate--tRNA ligase family protein [Candidatus Vidania fulgoroideorum]